MSFTSKISSYLNALSYLDHKFVSKGEVNFDYQYDIFCDLIEDLSSGEGLIFNTLFAKISYVGIKLNLKGHLITDMQIYRKESENNFNRLDKDTSFHLGQYVLSEILSLFVSKSDKSKLPRFKKPVFKLEKKEVKEKKLHGRYLLTGKLNSEEFLIIDEESQEEERTMRTDSLEVFRNTIEYLDQKVKENDLPVSLELIYIDIDSMGTLMPQMIVINPDLLIDVTSIAECFKPSDCRSDYYLLNKFAPTSKSKFVTVGNIVNNFLDIIVNDPTVNFTDLIKNIFYMDALAFCAMNDEEVKSTVKILELHFNNIKNAISENFPNIYLDTDHCVLEPSFYSPVFGLQGRLDLFHKKVGEDKAAIVELKSGKLFMPNTYGLNTNHYTQTLLYELLIKSTFNFKVKPLNFVLYSAVSDKSIRFAPSISVQQKEALSIRNDIAIIEENLVKAKSNRILSNKFSTTNFPSVTGFVLRDMQNLENIFNELSEEEKDYIESYASFIAREHMLSKVGYKYGGAMVGQATLWLLNDKEKEGNFAILSDLKIIETEENDHSVIKMLRSETNNNLVNFRKGDIVLLYPKDINRNKVIESQINKCTILELDEEEIVLKLRTKIKNIIQYQPDTLWNLEPDFLDSGFNKMHRSLTNFASSPKRYRDLILGKIPPATLDIVPQKLQDSDLTEEQEQMVQKIKGSKDYFLLWGPPGTGKTSMIIKHAVNQLVKEGQNVLLLAYTNRAVDELCEAVGNIDKSLQVKYIRIGSRYASSEKYKDIILDNIILSSSNRVQLTKRIKESQVFIATVSSMTGKEELFEIKKFDIIIVDEASQLLEPMLISLLHHATRFVLVGDHKQLPAVVTQSENNINLPTERLQNLGFSGFSTSLFERLFRTCHTNSWHWAYGMLSEQGRMHEEILKFPNEVFYDNKLKIISNIKRLSQKPKFKINSDIQSHLISKRMIYIDSAKEENDFAKINIDEAEKIKKIVSAWLDIYKLNNIDISNETIGIITTFKAQTAAIRRKLAELDIDKDLITVDTVERFQGSARDIIIYSMSVNSEIRLDQIINTDKDGLDRKLNVVITRTKEYFIMLGCEQIIISNPLYIKLINQCHKLEVL